MTGWRRAVGGVLCGWAAVAMMATGCDDLTFARGAGTACDRDLDCDQGLFCDAELRSCQPQLRNGAPCNEDRRCESSYCRDGVCCDGPCNAACLSCNQEEAVGQCLPAAQGADPRQECGDAARCAGAVPACQGSTVWMRTFGGLGPDDLVDLALGPDDDPYLVALIRYDAEVDLGELGRFAPEGDTPDFLVMALSLTGEPLWAVDFTGAGVSTPTSLATSEDGVFVAGSFIGSFLGETSADGQPDAFVVALSPSTGAPRWRRIITGAGIHHLEDLVALRGRVTAVGSTEGPAKLQPLALDLPYAGGGRDALWLSLAPANGDLVDTGTVNDPAGEPIDQFATAVTGVARGDDHQVAIAIAGEGTVQVADGQTLGLLDLDGPSNCLVFFLAGERATPLAFEGDSILPIEGQGTQTISALAMTSTNLYGAGAMTGEIGLPALVDHARGIDGFVLAAETDESFPRLLPLSGRFDVQPSAIAVHPNHDFVLLTGAFEVELQLDPEPPLASVGARDAFFYELDAASLEPRWATTFGGILDDAARAAVVDAEGNIYVAGRFEHELPSGESAVGAGDVFIARLAR